MLDVGRCDKLTLQPPAGGSPHMLRIDTEIKYLKSYFFERICGTLNHSKTTTLSVATTRTDDRNRPVV